MKKKVLLFVDNSKRDLLGVRLLETALKKKGIQTRLCNHKNWRVNLRWFKPHAVISSRADHRWAQKASECCRVFIVPSEGNTMTRETMLSVFLGRANWALQKVDWIKRCYLWNNNTFKWLIESGFKEEQLKVVGNVRMDPYRSPFIKCKPLSDPDNFVLGVAFSAKSVSQYSGSPHHPRAIYNFDKNLNFPFAQKGGHYEDLVWRDFAILRHMMRTLRYYLENMKGKVLLRPSPFEDPREYLFLEKLYPDRVKIAPRQEFVDWISNIDALLTCWSTTGIEALLFNVPVVSISGLIDQERLFRHINPDAGGFNAFVRMYHQPQSEELLFEFIKQAQSGTLPASSMSNEVVNQMLKDFYNWPLETDAAELIADDISHDLETASDTDKKTWAKCLPLPGGLPVLVCRFVYWANAMLEHFKTGAFSSDYDFYRTSNPRVEKLLRKIQKIK